MKPEDDKLEGTEATGANREASRAAVFYGLCC